MRARPGSIATLARLRMPIRNNASSTSAMISTPITQPTDRRAGADHALIERWKDLVAEAQRQGDADDEGAARVEQAACVMIPALIMMKQR